MKFLTSALLKTHNRKTFDCGNAQLNNYLQRQATQDIKRKLSACFVIANNEFDVKGYYTLSNGSVPQQFIPMAFNKKLPASYTDLPVTLLGRLAVDSSEKGKGLGKLLLIDALKRSFQASQTIGSMAVVVDPIDEAAKQFYLKFGFILLPDSGRMFLPMKTIAQLF